MRGRSRELFPADRGLQLRMVAALLMAAAATALLVGTIVVMLFTIYWPLAVLIVGAVLAPWPRAVRSRRNRYRPSGGTGPARRARRQVTAYLTRACAMADIAMPKVVVHQDLLAMSWTTAAPRRRPKLHVTTALVQRLDSDELAAAIAHEVGHLLNRDAWVMTIVAGPQVRMLEQIRALADDFRRDPHSAPEVVFVGPIAALLAAPGLFAARFLSRQREFAADRAAAVLTGSPTAVAAALVEVSNAMSGARAQDLRCANARDLFLFVPARAHDPTGIRRLWASHPPLEKRLAALDRMAKALHEG